MACCHRYAVMWGEKEIIENQLKNSKSADPKGLAAALGAALLKVRASTDSPPTQAYSGFGTHLVHLIIWHDGRELTEWSLGKGR